MDEKIVQEILHELFSSLESLDTQSSAILQFLSDKGIAKDEELASHLEQAGNASNVRWRAVRVRIDYLISGAIKAAEQEAKRPDKQESPKTTEKETRQEAKADTKQSNEKEIAKDAQQVAGNDKSEADETSARVEKDRNQADEANKNKKQTNDSDTNDNNNEPGKSADEKAA
jgi:hypothetical protein